MLKNEREQEIIDILKELNGFVSVKVLCERLYTSESSIRRDLTALSQKGILRRTHGGAELINNFSNISSFSIRSHYNAEAKKIIAKKASTLVKDGSTVFLDQSSTAFFLAMELINNSTITVVTNNIEIISLVSHTKLNLISSGGSLSHENRMSLVGPDAQYIFNNVYADYVFFATKSLTKDGTIWDFSRDEVIVRNSMIKNAKKKIFLCDSEKFYTQSAYKQCTLEDIDYLVCENDKAKEFSHISQKLTIL